MPEKFRAIMFVCFGHSVCLFVSRHNVYLFVSRNNVCLFVLGIMFICLFSA